MPSFIPLGKYKVTYLDGRVEDARSNFAAIMDLEAELPNVNAPDGTVLAHGIWIFLGRPKNDLRAWAADVYRIEPVADPTETTEDPTPPAVGDD